MYSSLLIADETINNGNVIAIVLVHTESDTIVSKHN